METLLNVLWIIIKEDIRSYYSPCSPPRMKSCGRGSNRCANCSTDFSIDMFGVCDSCYEQYFSGARRQIQEHNGQG